MTWITDADKAKRKLLFEQTSDTALQDLSFKQACTQYLPTIESSLKYIKEEGGLRFQKVYPPAKFDPNQTQIVSIRKNILVWKIWIPRHNSNGIYLLFPGNQVSFWCRLSPKISRRTTLDEINQAGIVNIVHQWFKFVYLPEYSPA